MERTKKKPLSAQIKSHSKKVPDKKSYDGNTEIMISTGSTLLDLAISGGRKRGGGIPGGILLEAFGPNSSGKTVLLCEIGGAIQRIGGDITFNDPEARLNKQFATMFDFDTNKIEINEPDTVTEVFDHARKWEPKTKAKIHGILTDSLAALSTNMEMDEEDGDKMGMRRAKEFSEGFRKLCRILKQENYIMACSNQIRDRAAIGHGEQFTVPGGHAIGFYSSIRLRFHKPEKVTKKKTVHGKEVKKVTGTKVKVEVYKNSCDAPYRTADIYIQFDYGIDDIRANLQYLKDYTKATQYGLCDTNIKNVLGKTIHRVGTDNFKSIEDAINHIEQNKMENELKEAVINLWEEIQDKFKVERKKKVR